MSVGQKLAKLKIRSTRVTFLSLHDLEAAPEETMQVRMLIKSSTESLGPYLFGEIEFWNFLGCHSWDTRGGVRTNPPPHGTVPAKSPHGIGLKLFFFMPHTKNSQPKISQHMIQPQLPLLHHHLTITANPTSLFGVIIVISGVSNCGPPQWPSLRYLASSYS